MDADQLTAVIRNLANEELEWIVRNNAGKLSLDFMVVLKDEIKRPSMSYEFQMIIDNQIRTELEEHYISERKMDLPEQENDSEVDGGKWGSVLLRSILGLIIMAIAVAWFYARLQANRISFIAVFAFAAGVMIFLESIGLIKKTEPGENENLNYDEFICSDCFAEVDEKDEYCNNCGAKLEQ